MSLMKLTLTPDQDGYNLEAPLSALVNKLAGGGSRLRRDLLNAPMKANVTWTLDEAQYNYIRTFHRFLDDGSQPFLMDLLVDTSTLTEHECRFIPGSFKLSTVKGGVRKVVAALEVIPIPSDDAYDEGLVTTYEAFGADGSEACALINTIANINMPGNLK